MLGQSMLKRDINRAQLELHTHAENLRQSRAPRSQPMQSGSHVKATGSGCARQPGLSGHTLRSGNGTAGRATSDVSSKKIRVSLKGIAYRKVGSFLLLA